MFNFKKKPATLANYIEQAKQKTTKVKIDLTRDVLLDRIGLDRMQDSYYMAGETSPQQRYAFASAAFGSNPEHAQRLYDYSSKHWFGYATPLLSFGRNKRGLPISCFSVLIPDTAEGLVDSLSESNWLSMLGGGVGLYFDIRSADTKSAGIIPHLKTYDASSLAYKQGTTRRGSYAVYMDVSNPEIVEFLSMRKVSGGDPNRKCLNLHNAVNIPDAFMEIIERCMFDSKANDDWELIDPKSKEVKAVVSAKELWVDILELRAGAGRGEPFILFSDTVNRAAPEAYKKHGLRINQSNICTEITLATDNDNTFVCALSSLNLEYWDEYKNNYLFFKDIAEMIDNALQVFIDYAPESISRAVSSAKRERSIGVGVMGFHSYLQSKNLPFECAIAKTTNINIFKTMRSQLNKANFDLGKERGSPEILKGTGQRFTHVMALAPTASNALITGNTSASIEPWRANAFRQDTLSGSYTQKNKWLDAVIWQAAYKKWPIEEGATPNDAGDGYLDSHTVDRAIWVGDQWQEVVNAAGSVQQLKWMDDETKDVFKTAAEIDNLWIIEHASDRQVYVDQAQSVNLFINPDISVPRLHAIHFAAWKKGLKTLYYCRSEKLHNTSVSKKVEKQRLDDDIQLMRDIAAGEACIACEG
jgi:ribonucleoside-diphosphate reductase alpha chain